MIQQTQEKNASGSDTLLMVLGVVALAAVAPGAVVAAGAAFAGARHYTAARHRRWWLYLTPERPWIFASLIAGALGLGASGIWAVTAIRDGDLSDAAAPVLLSLAAGIAAAPGAFVLGRRRLREQTLKSRNLDVLAGAQIADAILQANDELAARSVGVTLHEHTVELGVRDPAQIQTAPVAVEIDGRIRYGIGVLISDDSLTDFERSAHFTAPGCDLLLVPDKPGYMRALILASSGTGKSELLACFNAVAARLGMTVVFIDLKGQTDDARRFGEDARNQRDYLGSESDVTVVRGGWDFFDCDRGQLLERLMFIAPKTTSTDYYTNEMRRVLDIVIDGHGTRPLIGGLDDLTARLRDPIGTLGAAIGGPIGTPRGPNGTGPTEAGEILVKVDAMFAQLRDYLPKTGQGWSFAKLAPGSTTVVPLSPVKEPERLLAQLMLRDLRDELAARATTGIKDPLLVIVDEFPQMVTGEDDAADEAASIFETARTAGVDLIVAGQTIEGFSLDEAMQARLLGAGVGVFVGRSSLPDKVASAAGTAWNLEAAGDPHGHAINSARAQYTFKMPPQYVRRMHTGVFWLLHEGAVARFLSFRTR
ncbi:hypothetical protein AB0C65_35615 [Nocardia sp. NPDC048505]|uniref:hypothetical protein n=1 Tax=Nocardia sp. NPDC048505 TaxID=3155756 RepID=UPI0034100557